MLSFSYRSTTTAAPLIYKYSSAGPGDACANGTPMTNVNFSGTPGLCSAIAIQCDEFLLDISGLSVWVNYGTDVREAVIDDPNVAGTATFVASCTTC